MRELNGLTSLAGLVALAEGVGAMPVRYRNRLAQAKAGTRRLRIGYAGDSLDAGVGAGTGGLGVVNAKVNSLPAQLAGLFAAAGLKVSTDSIWGDNFISGTAGTTGVTEYDPKAVFAGSSWTRAAPGIGGNQFLNISGTDIFAFTPAQAGQNVEVYYSVSPGWGTFTIKDGATTLATVNASTTLGFTKSTLTRALSANAINIARTGVGERIAIAGIDCWANDTQVSVFNMGAAGSATSNWIAAGSPWTQLNSVPFMALDLIFLGLHTNDIRSGVSAATWKSRMQTLIDAYKGTSDIVLVRKHLDNAPVNASLVPQYKAAFYELAASNGLPIIDFGDDASITPGMYFDSVHLLASGYGVEAAREYEWVG